MSKSEEIGFSKDGTADRKYQVQYMFDRIAFRYDLLNHLLSFNIDRVWRRKVIHCLKKYRPSNILDVATGTGDLAIQAAKTLKIPVTAVDLSEQMLSIAKDKVQKAELGSFITCRLADAESLPYADSSFNAAMVAFGVRNFSDLAQGLAELYRILTPGGIVVILEFSLPRHFPVRQIYLWYFRQLLPLIGQKVSKDQSAYRYLNRSVEAFPERQAFLSLLKDAGFTSLTYSPLTFGVSTIYQGMKPDKPFCNNEF